MDINKSRLKRAWSVRVTALFILSLGLTGCMGWGDTFAPKHYISGDYFLMLGEPEDPNQVFLLSKGSSISIAGPMDQMGWNKDYIIFTDRNWPQPWSVIRVKDHQKFTITEKQRLADPSFRGIVIKKPSDAWNAKIR